MHLKVKRNWKKKEKLLCCHFTSMMVLTSDCSQRQIKNNKSKQQPLFSGFTWESTCLQKNYLERYK